MKRYFISLFVFSIICLAFANTSKAQYEDIRFPQSSEEIKLFQKLNIMGETEWSLENDKRIAYYTRAFDRQGRMVISAEYYHRKYYLYDNKGNVISYMDSARKDDGFVVSEYKFKYDDDGNLSEMTGPHMKSTFKYDNERKMLYEALNKNDTLYNNVFSFDLKGKLREVQFYNEYKKLVLHLVKSYGPTGQIYKETLTKKGESSRDSTLTVFEYNANMQLNKKERFRFMTQYLKMNGGISPDHSATHQDVATTTYNLDERGKPIEEEFTIKGDRLSYHYSSWKYDKNGLLIKDTYRVGHMEPRILEHEYIYFDK